MAVSVKDFLDAIRGRFNDEPNKVEVTGSKIEIIKSYELRHNDGQKHFGEITSDSTLDISDMLDISKYSEVNVTMRNLSNGQVTDGLRVLTRVKNADGALLSPTYGPIPSTTTFIVDKKNHEGLETLQAQLIQIRAELEDASAGSLYIDVLGRI